MVQVAAKTLVLIVPHSQDPGRLYAYSQLWAPAALAAVKAQIAHASSALRSSLQTLGLSGPSTGDERRANASAAGPIGRIALSVDLQAAALRFENHPLERHLTCTLPVHLRTASAVAALHDMASEYEALRATAVTRSATHQASDPQVPQVTELPLADNVCADLVQPLLLQHR